MTTSVNHFQTPPPVLSYAGPVAKTPVRLPRVPWLAIVSGFIAWIPVLLSLIAGSPVALAAAPILGMLGLLIAIMCVIDPDERPVAHHVAASLSLLSTLAGTVMAISALLS